MSNVTLLDTDHELETLFELETAPTVTVCQTCGTVTLPGADCLEVGQCSTADTAAARRSNAGQTSKYAVPASWNARGMVD